MMARPAGRYRPRAGSPYYDARPGPRCQAKGPNPLTGRAFSTCHGGWEDSHPLLELANGCHHGVPPFSVVRALTPVDIHHALYRCTCATGVAHVPGRQGATLSSVLPAPNAMFALAPGLLAHTTLIQRVCRLSHTLPLFCLLLCVRCAPCHVRSLDDSEPQSPCLPVGK